MLYRKVSKEIEAHLASPSDKILVLEGARQIGKSFIIREIGNRLFKNFVEVNFAEDDEGPQHFKNIHSTEAFYFTLSMVAGNQLGNFDDTWTDVVEGCTALIEKTMPRRKGNWHHA